LYGALVVTSWTCSVSDRPNWPMDTGFGHRSPPSSRLANSHQVSARMAVGYFLLLELIHCPKACGIESILRTLTVCSSWKHFLLVILVCSVHLQFAVRMRYIHIWFWHWHWHNGVRISGWLTASFYIAPPSFRNVLHMYATVLSFNFRIIVRYAIAF